MANILRQFVLLRGSCTLWFLGFLVILPSCYRDNICDCYWKKGCRIIHVINNTDLPIIVEKTKYCPQGRFDINPEYNNLYNSIKVKYDSLAIVTGYEYSMVVIDSINYDTLKNIKGAETYNYKLQGYTCRCHD